MKRFVFMALAVLLFMVLFGWTVGSLAHWLYWTMMVIASKLAFGLLYAIPAAIILALVFYILVKPRR